MEEDSIFRWKVRMSRSKGKKSLNIEKPDHGILLIHGIGNRKRGSTLRKQGKVIAGEIANLASSENFRQSEYPLKKTSKEYVIDCGFSSPYKKVYIRESHWSDNNTFKNASKQKILWLLIRIPLILIFFFYDWRDLSSKNTLSKIFRILIRITIGLSLSSIPILTIRYIFRGEYSNTSILIVYLILLVLIILAFIAIIKLFNYIRIAVEGKKELLDIEEGIRKDISLFPKTVKKISIVAHSQGGYLAYKLLENKSPEAKKVHRLFCVGSGIIPITILKEASMKRIIYSWFLFFLFISLVILGTLFLGDSSIYLFYQLIKIIIVDLNPIQMFLGALGAQSMNASGAINFIGWVDIIKFSLFLAILMLAHTVIYIFSKIILKITINPLDIKVWEEYSSVHDIVGRLSPLYFLHKNSNDSKKYPSIRPVGIPGSPLTVHLNYFKDYSSVPYVVSEYIYRCTKPDRSVEESIYKHSLRRRNFLYISSTPFMVMLAFYFYDVRINDKSFTELYLAFIGSVFSMCILLYIPVTIISSLGNLKLVRNHINIDISDKYVYYRALTDKNSSLLKAIKPSLKVIILLLILAIFSLSMFSGNYVLYNVFDGYDKNVMGIYALISYVAYIFSSAILVGYSGKLINKCLYFPIIAPIMLLLMQGMVPAYSLYICILFICYITYFIIIYKRWGLLKI